MRMSSSSRHDPTPDGTIRTGLSYGSRVDDALSIRLPRTSKHQSKEGADMRRSMPFWPYVPGQASFLDMLTYQEALETLAQYLGPGGEKEVIEGCLIRLYLQASGMGEVAYHSFEIPKKSGGKRLILVPHEPLMDLLRLVKSELIDRCPVGRSPHGFRKRRSAVTNARIHLQSDARYALNVDIKDCFPSTQIHRINRVLDEAIGQCMRREDVPDQVVRMAIETLSTLMTFRYGRGPVPALPIGTPTSPSVLNVILRPFDERLLRKLRGISSSSGQVFTYTRYGDDMTISSPDPLPRNLVQIMTDLLHNFGYRPNQSKTKLMELGGSGPPIEVTGIIVSHDRLLLPDEWLKETERMLLDFVYHPQGSPKKRAKTARRIRGKLSLCRSIYNGVYPTRITHTIAVLGTDRRPFVEERLLELSGRSGRAKDHEQTDLERELQDAEDQLADPDYVPVDELTDPHDLPLPY